MTAPIPPEQLQRIQPVLDAVLTQLRQQTERLTPLIGLAVEYHPEAAE